MTQPKFDRGELLEDLRALRDDDDMASDICLTAAEAHDALKLALAVVDEAAPTWDEGKRHVCAICGAYDTDEDPHKNDCPVRACVEAGLVK